MVQLNDYHPHYFLKPSLHFYLRMPAVAGGFLWSARAGEMRSVHEIVTTDPNVPDGIARTASHPRIVMWARSVTLPFSLLLILATAGIASRFVANRSLAVVAAALVACAPPLIQDSEKIGVDTLMAAMCLVTAWLSLRVLERPTLGRMALAGLAAGLAVSSKYNAMPIVVVPLLACLLSGRFSPSMLTAALGLPAVGFFAGTPYGLFYPADLLNGMAQEIVHYGILGHDNATVEPGWPHAVGFLPSVVKQCGGRPSHAGRYRRRRPASDRRPKPSRCDRDVGVSDGVRRLDVQSADRLFPQHAGIDPVLRRRRSVGGGTAGEARVPAVVDAVWGKGGYTRTRLRPSRTAGGHGYQPVAGNGDGTREPTLGQCVAGRGR